MKVTISNLAAALVFSSVSTVNAASLTGDSITVEYLFDGPPALASLDNIVVGPGAEISCPGLFDVCSEFNFSGSIALDFGPDTITFIQTYTGTTGGYSTTAGFNGWVFSGIDFGTGITGVTITDSGFDTPLAPFVDFSSDTISLDLEGRLVGNSNSWTMTLQTAAPVPVPASALLLGAGLAGFGWMKRRKT